MKKKISFILLVTILVSFVNTFAYENLNSNGKYLDLKTGTELRDNRYYYTIRYENEENYTMYISEADAQNERSFENEVKDFISSSMGLYNITAGFVLKYILKFYHGPYSSAGTYYISKSTCKRIKHDRLTGEEIVTDVGMGIEISHNGRTFSSNYWY